MNEITIENVKFEDLKQVAQINVQSWQETYKNIVDKDYLNNLSIEKRLEKLLNNYKEGPFLVAKKNNEVVGFCRYKEYNDEEISNEIDCELTVLYVKPELKNNGIGTKLINTVKKDLMRKNKKNMIVYCLKENKIGKDFYTKMEGKIIGEKEIEIGNKVYQEVAFKFNL